MGTRVFCEAFSQQRRSLVPLRVCVLLCKMESGDRVALLAPPLLYPTSIPSPRSLNTHGFKQMEGWIVVELLLSNPPPRIPRIIEHTHQGDKDKGIMENRYGWCWFSLGYSTHALLRESDKDKYVDLKIRKSLPHLTTVSGVFSQELRTPAPCTGGR